MNEDAVVDSINKDFAEYKMEAYFDYDFLYFTFRYTIKYPNASTAREAAEEFKNGSSLDSVIPSIDPKGEGEIFSKRKGTRTVEFELTIPETIVWKLMKNKKAQSVANPQKVLLKYLEEILEIFVNDDRAYYTKL